MQGQGCICSIIATNAKCLCRSEQIVRRMSRRVSLFMPVRLDPLGHARSVDPVEAVDDERLAAETLGDEHHAIDSLRTSQFRCDVDAAPTLTIA